MKSNTSQPQHYKSSCVNDGSASSSQNRKLFEGSAALHLRWSHPLCFILHRDKPSHRRGCRGNSGYEDDANDPFATASSLTYHEPLSRPSAGEVGTRGGADIASLLAGNGSAMSQELMQISLAGLIGGNNSQDHLGELHGANDERDNN
eukprot:scaffold1064_cov209-Skeletonema_marinoi.AAC.7